jgi:hypothetical protein
MQSLLLCHFDSCFLTAAFYALGVSASQKCAGSITQPVIWVQVAVLRCTQLFPLSFTSPSGIIRWRLPTLPCNILL